MASLHILNQKLTSKIYPDELKVTPHDGRSFYKTGHRALNSYVFPDKFGVHNSESSPNLTR